MCAQVSSPVSKLEITRLLQPLYVFKSSRAHLRRCVFCSSVSKWGTHLAQTFLRSKCFFRIVCTLPSDMPVQLAISLTDNRKSCSTTIFTAAMLALVTEVLGLPGWVSSSTENNPVKFEPWSSWSEEGSANNSATQMLPGIFHRTSLSYGYKVSVLL